MAHGTPDYGITNGRQTTYQVADLGELAVRLGSPVIFDRRGDVMWWDDFECATNRYDGELGGTGAALSRVTTRAHSGAYSYQLTAGSDGTSLCEFIGSEPALVRSKVGMSVMMNLPGTISRFQVIIESWDGVNGHLAVLIWDGIANTLSYMTAGSVQVVFATAVNLPVNLPTWCAFKVVADLEDNVYVRAIVNNVTYPLPGIALDIYPDARPARVDFAVRLVGRAGYNDVVYIDDLVLTQNEP